MLVHPEIVARLDNEDLMRWQMWRSRGDAIGANPRLYSRDELEQHFMKRLQLWREFTEKYRLEDSPFVNIDASSGAIYYMNDRQDT